jgi:hypothetical protein
MRVHILGYKCILLRNIGAKFPKTSAMPCISPAKACALPTDRMTTNPYFLAQAKSGPQGQNFQSHYGKTSCTLAPFR